MRQLDSVVKQSILLADNSYIESDVLSADITCEYNCTTGLVPKFELPATGINFELFEKDLIAQAMERSNGVIGKAALLLGMSYKTFQYRLEKFGINRKDNNAEGDVLAAQPLIAPKSARVSLATPNLRGSQATPLAKRKSTIGSQTVSTSPATLNKPGKLVTPLVQPKSSLGFHTGIPLALLKVMTPKLEYSRADLTALTGISSANWTWVIRQLRESGQVVQVGEKSSARYRLKR